MGDYQRFVFDEAGSLVKIIQMQRNFQQVEQSINSFGI